MNLILLFESDYSTTNRVVICDRRFHHIRQFHQPVPGQQLRVGLLNGATGSGTVICLTDQSITLEVELVQQPPAALPLTLLLALPRPKMLKRTLQTITSMGVKQLYLINSYKVDKSYWSTPALQQDNLREQLLLGLEQSGDTVLPEVHLRKRFKPFVEDELPEIARQTRALVAHPYHAAPCPGASDEATTLAIGPEGGFIPYEVEKLQACGFEAIHIGQRILRVENAVPVLLARLFPI
ncbi:16S rRNA (uracil(1498)-N(3))-methyltransferase [Amphritea pacifica]|uniref:Ribosomal RNA small subunit methyltransferase E n=1 Tax=Amphritea pacifica TaxID=2811233 RepID=A0ABS2W7K8_9GAMM|nr:16S rRNA (uracil(1498)-N(3))-methyltransferase [Amphritea pacifica]MBN0987689.1 16S rRNA (uracil(1498)-N(3))-methyltransferase [Amphritea pacifica]MBN1007726.1 16S rRNA (uracil(1498)-N(3))-methyltransferase [Amphritea pacifica]